MDVRFDISDFVDVLTEQTVLCGLVERFKKRRKELKISQKELSRRSFVSYGSIRRFETCGEISLGSLLKISEVIDCLNDFESLFKTPKLLSLKD